MAIRLNVKEVVYRASGHAIRDATLGRLLT